MTNVLRSDVLFYQPANGHLAVCVDLDLLYDLVIPSDSLRKVFSHLASLISSQSAITSTFIVDCAAILCFILFQLINLSPKLCHIACKGFVITYSILSGITAYSQLTQLPFQCGQMHVLGVFAIL